MSEAIQLLTKQCLLLSSLFGTLSAPETVTATALHFFGFENCTKVSYSKSKSVTCQELLIWLQFKFAVVYFKMETAETTVFNFMSKTNCWLF